MNSCATLGPFFASHAKLSVAMFFTQVAEVKFRKQRAEYTKLIEVWQAPSMRRISITLNSSHALRLQLHTHLARPFFQAGDTDGIMELLTDSNVEARLLERVQKKASTYGQEIGGAMQHDERRSRFPP